MAGYALLGPRWSSNTVTWSIARSNYQGQLAGFEAFYDEGVFAQDLRVAFTWWAHVADLNFVEVADALDVDVRIGLASIDGPRGTLGVASYSFTTSPQGSYLEDTIIRFDTAESYTDVGGEARLAGGLSYRTLAAHEIGHTLGLDHYTAEPAIMNPFLTPSIPYLTQSDVDGIRALYGASGPTDFSDTITGTVGSDTLAGYGGDDAIYGGRGLGDPSDGPDTVLGGLGNDRVFGNAGDDALYGNAGQDVVYGGIGNDTIYGGDGPGDPNDAGDSLFGGEGSDTLFGNAGNDIIYGGRGVGDASDAADVVYAGRGNDIVFGNGGADILFGNEDNDALYGGIGNDTLNGGTGADRFIFSAGDGNDTVVDLSSADGDRIHLNGQSYVARQVDDGTMLDLSGGGHVLLLNVSSASVTSDLFA